MAITSQLKFKIAFVLGLWCLQGFSDRTDEKQADGAPQDPEIVFHSNGSSFSPVIILEGPAEVTWTWADLTTSTSTRPTKDYGSAQLRKNSLKVNPWSALRRINIGYDALDGGSPAIELVPDQQVSLVENLSLVAPFLKEWCSSYNILDSLDFSNFVNIETIECYRSRRLRNVKLANTPKLKRACLEDEGLLSLDLSGSPSLEDLRGALNNFKTIIFPSQTVNLWHLCVRDNPQITDPNLLNNFGLYPNIAELFIWNTNQQGSLVIPHTNTTREVYLEASRNKFSSLDLRGSFKAVQFPGIVEMSHNQLSSVNITGCAQIKKLDLSDNQLESLAIDQVLQQVDAWQTSKGEIDLRVNQPPTATGRATIARLVQRGWNVMTEPDVTGSAPQPPAALPFKLLPHSSHRTLQLQLNQMPQDPVWLEIHDSAGRKILGQRIHQAFTLLTLPPAPKGIYLVSLRTRQGISIQKLLF